MVLGATLTLLSLDAKKFFKKTTLPPTPDREQELLFKQMDSLNQGLINYFYRATY